MSDRDRPAPGRPRHLVRMMVVGCLAALAAVFWFRKNPIGPGDDLPPHHVSKLSAAEKLRLLELKNTGIGYLENQKFADADGPLAEVARKLPTDPLGPRNLAINRLLAIQDLPGDTGPAREAIELLKQAEPNSTLTARLAARLAMIQGDADQQLAQLKLATELAPNDAVAWHELFQAQNESFAMRRKYPDEPPPSEMQGALEKAVELQPNNLVLLADTDHLLSVLARAENPKTVDILTRLRSTLPDHLVESVQQQSRINLPEVIDQMEQAAKAGQWQLVQQRSHVLGNVLKPQPLSKSDRKRISPHLLDNIVHDFRSDFYVGLDKPSADSEKPIRVIMQTTDSLDLQSKGVVRDVRLADFDLDSRLELVVLLDKAVEVFGRNKQESEWESRLRLELPAAMTGMILADLDDDVNELPPGAKPPGATSVDDLNSPAQADADLEVIVFGQEGVLIFRNTVEAAGQRQLVAVEQTGGLVELRDIRHAVAGDFDHDGDLDLMCSTPTGVSLWANVNNLQFKNITSRLDKSVATTPVKQFVLVDWDRDLDTDVLFVAETDGRIGYFENLGSGQFRRRWLDEEPVTTDGSLGWPKQADWLVLLDVDANASWDLLLAQGDKLTLCRTATNSSGAVKLIETKAVGSGDKPFADVRPLDFDNDGSLDFVGWDAGAFAFHRWSGTDFVMHSAQEPKPTDAGDSFRLVATEIADIDADGDEDVIVAATDRLFIVTNQGGNKNHWLDVRLRAQQVKASGMQATESGRVNHYGVGSLLELRAGKTYRPLVVTGQTTHFGLRDIAAADIVRVLWTNGNPQAIIQPKHDQLVYERQSPLGSCPFVYTWTGERFEFLTDCLWGAPIGLQFAEGVFAPSRAWEYLFVPGDRLAAKDGRYLIQLTEELWEATYLDAVQLIAVDHPADVEVFSNEKVGPPDLAEFRVHTVRERRVPIAARDQRGRDILDVIRNKDERFTQSWDHKLRQGLVEDHFLELDLGKLENPQRITLFLTGWIYPTDSSINVSLSQNPTGPQPTPPSLWVPDKDGQWRRARPFMGFPGGKTKTIAVDLTGLFPANDHRVRIATNMEFRWDEAFFTVDEAPAEIKLHRLPVTSADLHYRGFSTLRPNLTGGPDTYDYGSVSSAPAWPPMEGRFTRFGNVAELVRNEDDRQVVFGAGDEITLSFAVPDEPLQSGWKRDFLLYNVGWDKDANLNTVYGQSSEPLPFRSMSGYPFRADESFPDTTDHRRYLNAFQTREQNWSEFWKALRP
ncbi:MAG: VCBS repeat-containing protein [Planctomycetales bacterium]|nr:VCBS repeat-containing protein [Planctomycetales bacterium]